MSSFKGGRPWHGRLSVVMVAVLALASWSVAVASAYPEVSHAVTMGAAFLGAG